MPVYAGWHGASDHSLIPQACTTSSLLKHALVPRNWRRLRATYICSQLSSHHLWSQVEAARRGLELLDKSQRHVLKLRACMGRIQE